MPQPRPALARAAVLLGALWLLAGALAKLFAGNPMAMPESVREHAPFGLDLTFRLVIAIELAIVLLAVFKPHVGWLPLAGLFAFFVTLLVPMVLAGAASCGCMGESIKFPPAAMLAIDSVVLLGILVTRPWDALRGPGLPTAALLAAAVVCCGSPWVLIRSSAGLPPAAGPAGSGAAAAPDVRYVLLEPERWVGRPVYEVEQLTAWISTDKLPLDGRIVLWRQGCDHCAAHLREMANKDDGSRQILLVQARDDLKNSRAVDAMPQGGHVTTFEFPENLQCAFETPCEVVVEGGVVKAALHEKDFKKD